jgi:hypothetical protein
VTGVEFSIVVKRSDLNWQYGQQKEEVRTVAEAQGTGSFGTVAAFLRGVADELDPPLMPLPPSYYEEPKP